MTKPRGTCPGASDQVVCQRAGTLSGVVVMAARFMSTTVTGLPVSWRSFSGCRARAVGRASFPCFPGRRPLGREMPRAPCGTRRASFPGGWRGCCPWSVAACSARARCPGAGGRAPSGRAAGGAVPGRSGTTGLGGVVPGWTGTSEGQAPAVEVTGVDGEDAGGVVGDAQLPRAVGRHGRRVDGERVVEFPSLVGPVARSTPAGQDRGPGRGPTRLPRPPFAYRAGAARSRVRVPSTRMWGRPSASGSVTAARTP